MGEKEKLFLWVEHQLIKVEWITELGYHYLANSIVVTDLGKNHQYMLQLMGESLNGNKISL